ncbi:Maf family protein [Candidatus Methylobacter oryzae]|uniref:7-methyl-GTP pyrophosphatase n=1 Tax=Candidatus Methylobacter oryzae TaxID=2497749 RepID=A0ABY3C8L3_9GAMM|nr:nucleoside triphosphate pyrophosphatase [Candidatus Methylobacter oryzae]TRW92698.1 septum formation inhibitor Maf [Candidatus Methylobacter oryzae]
MTTAIELILASSSPYRRELLKKLGLTFDTASADIDETPLPDEEPMQTAMRLSLQKAAALAPIFPQHLIIGSDQVAMLKGKPLTKPGSRENTIAQLAAASGKTANFYTGICVYDSRNGQHRVDCDHCAVTFRALSRQQIEHYVDRDEPFNCAGGFKAESLGIALFERIKGDDPNALIGLPLIKLIRLLEVFGVRVI